MVREVDLEITQVSANVLEVLGHEPEALLGRHLSVAIGAHGAKAVGRATQAFGDLRERNPHETTIRLDGGEALVDVVLHRADHGLLLVELERAAGLRPLAFANTYLAVRSAITALNIAATLCELFDVTAAAVRELTGFDRVMVYTYDANFNGEVVGESKLDSLNPFLGLHYPAGDIPAQARSLYEKNWLRLIDDVSYEPVRLVPTLDPVSGAPLDLTYSTLRSVSPVHLECLQNMGVRASMSISLLRDGKLWGLIACHHYSGPHTPAYGIRAASEFLGSTLSLRLIARHDEGVAERRINAQATLSQVLASALDPQIPLAEALTAHVGLLHLIGARSVVARLGGHVHTLGPVPPDESVQAIVDWARGHSEDVVSTDCLAESIADPVDPDEASGALVLVLPDDQFLVWLREETPQHLDWGGDPQNKAMASQETDDIRISPRKSFERWRESVSGRSLAWSEDDRQIGAQLRRHIVEALYARARLDVRLAESVQRSLLPLSLPVLPGWDLSARYEPASGGRVGGDSGPTCTSGRRSRSSTTSRWTCSPVCLPPRSC